MTTQKDTGANTPDFKAPRPGAGLAILLLAFIVCLAIASILLPLLMMVVKRPEAAMRIATVVQDLLIFIIPAVAAAMLSTRLPARLLGIDSRPRLGMTALSVITLIVAAPALNCIIEWNQSIHLPASMAGVESWLRQMETSAAEATDLMLAGNSLGTLAISILIVGVLAGFSEELFFRGALQRLLMSTPVGTHVAIWLTAFVFSAIHMQFFGFIPRLLLGAYFGYLLWWTGSLWVPVIVHVVNNSIVVLGQWHTVNEGGTPGVFDNFGANLSNTPDLIAAIISLVLTILCLWQLHRMSHTATQPSEPSRI